MELTKTWCQEKKKMRRKEKANRKKERKIRAKGVV
jgi:hypothetical protein